MINTNFQVRHIHVAAHDDGFLFAMLSHVLQEQCVPAHSFWQRDQLSSGIGNVHADQIKLCVIGGNQATLTVQLLVAKSVFNVEWHDLIDVFYIYCCVRTDNDKVPYLCV